MSKRKKNSTYNNKMQNNIYLQTKWRKLQKHCDSHWTVCTATGYNRHRTMTPRKISFFEMGDIAYYVRHHILWTTTENPSKQHRNNETEEEKKLHTTKTFNCWTAKKFWDDNKKTRPLNSNEKKDNDKNDGKFEGKTNCITNSQ